MYNGHVYCPFTIPTDAPPEAKNKPPALRWKDQSPRTISTGDQLKHNQEVRRIVFNCWKNNDWNYGKLHGLSRMSIFTELISVDMVRSFVLDAMHLYFENILGTLFDHWRGKPLNEGKSKGLNNTAGHRPEANDNEDPERGGHPNQTDARQPEKKQRSSIKQRFWKTYNIYNINPGSWEVIGKQMAASSKLLPTDFGAHLRNIHDHYSTFKANEWQNWALLVAPILLRDVLEEECYINFMCLVSAITVSMDLCISTSDIANIKEDICTFLEHYEKTYYQYKYQRLSACTSQFHYLEHIPDMLDWVGPVWACWQFPTERMCGIIVSGVRSRIQANRNISLTILHTAQLYSLRYLAGDTSIYLRDHDNGTPDTINNEESQDKDMALNHLMKRLAKSGPRTRHKTDEETNVPGSNTLIGEALFALQTYNRKLIKDWYTDCGIVIAMSDIPISPAKVRAWKRVRLSNAQVARALHYTRIGEKNQDSSVVRYESHEYDRTQLKKISKFGHLLLMISPTIPVHSLEYEDSYDLCLIQSFNVEANQWDGNLLRIQSRANREFQLVDDIKEVCGRIRKDGIDYIVGQYTAFMV